MPDPYLASNEFPGDGVTTLYNISFKGNRPDAGSGVVPYLSSADVKAQVITPAVGDMPEIVVDVPIVFVGPNQFSVTPATPVGKITRIYRATQDEYNLVDYQALQTVGEADLDLSTRQVIFVTQEAHDLALRASITASDSGVTAAMAVATAEAAVATAADAVAQADNALAIAASAVTTANTATDIAEDANTTADAAVVQAAAAVATANGIAATADAALTAANAAVVASSNAVTIANAASATANGIAATADTALTNSNTAITTANAIAGTASAALSAANAAVVTANAASATATSAASDAATALSTANSVASIANDALAAANAAVVTANAAQPGDATLTALAGLATAADQMIYSTGANAFSMTALSAFIRTLLDDANSAAARATLGVQDVGTSHISGLVPSWASAQSVVCSGGTAYVPGLSKAVTAPSAATFTFIPTSNTWYYIYLTEITGTPTLEISTTAPAAPYEGTARCKAGDTSRRFVSAVRSGPGGFRPFIWAEDYVTYVDTLGVVVTVNAATDVGPTAVSASAVVPPTTRRCFMQVYSAAGNSLTIGVAFDMFFLSLAPSTRGVFPMITTSDQVIVYKHLAAVTGGTTIDIRSFGSER